MRPACTTLGSIKKEDNVISEVRKPNMHKDADYYKFLIIN